MAPHRQPNDYFGNSDSESDGEFVGFTDGDYLEALGRVTDGISVDDKSEDESEGVNNGNSNVWSWLAFWFCCCLLLLIFFFLNPKIPFIGSCLQFILSIV